jgi:hypothetical protein
MRAQQTRESYRVEAVDFTRDRAMTFPRVATMILRGHKVSQQNGLNKFFRELDRLDQLPTASAYCQARRKLNPELFVHLNEMTNREFVELSQADGSLKRWHGHRVFGVDGTKLNLPDTAQLRESFSLITNQYEQGKCVQALAVVLYDLLNDLGVAASLSPLVAEKEPLLNQLWQSTAVDDLLVMDRGFLDYSVIAFAVATNRHVTIRCPRYSFSEINDFWLSDEKERIVRLRLSRRQRKFARERKLPEQVQVRLLKFPLPSGEQETLLTTLCDPVLYPAQDFYQLYGLRWNEETYFDRVKNTFEVERFSGHSERIIRQDFFGVIFLATLDSVLCQSAQDALTQQDAERRRKLPSKVNRAVSYVTLIDHAVGILADDDLPPEDALQQLHKLLKTNPTRHPPGRRYERPSRSVARSLRHQRYRKRLMA